MQAKLGSTWLERNLGILVDSKLSMSEHSAAAAKKGNRVLGYVNKAITSRGYSALVRPHIQYCAQFGPCYIEKMDRLEWVEKRATMVKDWEACHRRKV